MNPIIQRLKSKTYLTALALTLLTALELNLQMVLPHIPLEYRDYAVFLWPAAMLTLRELTNSAISSK